jgi:hypothetical protein
MSETTAQGTDIRAVLGESGLVDTAWYLARNPDVAAVGVDPLLHYIVYGAGEGRAPNRWFDAAWYARQYPDVPKQGVEPLLHYVAQGDAEGRRPHPYFDAEWHRAAYQVPADASALRHFLANRTDGRFAPCPELYAVPFLAPYRADPAGSRDPFAHYLEDMERRRQEAFPDLQVIALSGLVDPDYHRINASDAYESELDPVLHYCRFGWREQRRPNPYFDTAWYVATNPDVARLKINPLVHYLLEGETKDRRPIVTFDPGWYRATYKVPDGRSALAHFLAHRRSGTVSPNGLFDAAWYVRQRGADIGTNQDPFSHYLQASVGADVDPSLGFDAAAYRRQHMAQVGEGPPLTRGDQDIPLVHCLRSQYR